MAGLELELPPHRRRQARRILVVLVALDLALIAAFVLRSQMLWAGVVDPLWWRLDMGSDRSLAENFNKAKWLAIVALLAATWVRVRIPTALGFAITFAAVAADDLLKLHELQGAAIVEALGITGSGGLQAQDLGELLIWAALGVPVVLALVIGFLASGREGRRIGVRLLGFFAALVVLAIGLDMLHARMDQASSLAFFTGLVEDGGEMLVGSFCVAYCVRLLLSSRAPASR